MSANVVRLVMPAKTEYLIVARLALAGIAREVPMGDSVLADLKLAVTEACGNAVRYARPSDESVILVKFTIDDGAIEICVEDEGPDRARSSSVRDGHRCPATSRKAAWGSQSFALSWTSSRSAAGTTRRAPSCGCAKRLTAGWAPNT